MSAQHQTIEHDISQLLFALVAQAVPSLEGQMSKLLRFSQEYLMEQIFEKSWSLLGHIIRYLVVDILIDVVLHWLGYGWLKLLKILTGGRFPTGPLVEQSSAMRIGGGIVVLLFLIWLIWGLI